MRWCILLLTLNCLLGCGRVTNMVSDDKLKEYETLLSTSLDAWKAGKAKQLDKGDNPIRFVDDDAVAGLKLTDYQIKTAVRKNLPFQTFQVQLDLRDLKNRDLSRPAVYQVTLAPRPAVLRSDP